MSLIKEISREKDLLNFMQSMRVAATPQNMQTRIIEAYRNSTLEAARIPADWFSLDLQIAEYA